MIRFQNKGAFVGASGIAKDITISSAGRRNIE
jgi:hypothetical protein